MILNDPVVKITQINAQLNRLYFLAIFVLLSGGARENVQYNDTGNIRFGAWDYDWMQKVRSSLKEADPAYQPAYEKLVSDAEIVMKDGDFSVTYKEVILPGVTKYDFMSMGPYWWSDPGKENGLKSAGNCW
ncbi:MAG: hypothetical protein PHH93_05515 [Prolixibacteraceae bacterium]|nr:hypothetical protein [Prolixibacteraceae bacterium]